MKQTYLAALSMLALVACNKSASDNDGTDEANVAARDAANMTAEMPPPAIPGEAGVTTDPATYVARAGAGDMFEIESSRAVLDKTKNADVRRFAQMMIDEHQKATSKVKTAASGDTVTMPAAVMAADQQTMLDDIRSADAASVDRVYAQHQRTAHTAALALHQGFANGPGTGKLKTTASDLAATVQKHIAELDKLEASIIAGR